MSQTAASRAVALRPAVEGGGDERIPDVKLLLRLAPFARSSTTLFVAAGLLSPVVVLSGLVQPLLQRAAIQAALVDRSATAVSQVALGFAGAILVEFAARFAQTYALQLGGQKTVAAIRRAAHAKVQSLPMARLDRTPVGRLVTRVTNDAEAIGEFFASGAILGVVDVITLAGIVGFMLYVDVPLTLVTFVALPPLLVVVQGIRVRAREAFRAIRSSVAQLNAYTAEQAQGLSVVGAFGLEAACQREFRAINAEHRDANFRAIRYDALLYSVVESIAAVTVAILLWFATVRAGWVDAAAGAAYAGTVVAFYEYVQRFFGPIRDLTTKYTILQSSLAAAERVLALLSEPETDAPRVALPNSENASASTESERASEVLLELQNVSFAYRPGRDALKNVELAIRRGERLAIVGPTGSGKTTLTALLLRLYDVSAGAIILEGRDVRTLTRQAVRGRFACVPQDVFLFAGSVAENVASFDPRRNDARVRRCLERTAAWDLVCARGGLDARVEERGTNFSVGERQLIALARALYLDREILVLDEATASVDSDTEARLERAIAEVMQGRTAIVIAHRLSTVRTADRIVVMHRGKIAELGTHEELLRRGGLYARLHELQFAR